MTNSEPAAAAMRTLRFHGYGEPADVLRLDDAAIPDPGPGRIRVLVHACGINPADGPCAGACSPATSRAGSGWRFQALSKRWARA